MMTCATMEENFALTADLSHAHPEILPFFGIHPWFLDTLSPGWKERLLNCLLSTPSGVGETGIDFTDKTADRDLQVQVFEHHLALAMALSRPINIHVRNAWDTFIHILKRFGRLKTPGLIHSYSGSADMIPIFEAHGLYLSFSGSVTNPGAKKVVNALTAVSVERFVLETDTPDIYPYIENPSITRLNEPKNLPAISQIAADRIHMDVKRFRQHAFNNSVALFYPIWEREKI
jgi:TatD DNase family protein